MKIKCSTKRGETEASLVAVLALGGRADNFILQGKSHLCIPFLGIALPQAYLYIPRIGPQISLQQNRQTDPGNIQISHRLMSVGTG